MLWLCAHPGPQDREAAETAVIEHLRRHAAEAAAVEQVHDEVHAALGAADPGDDAGLLAYAASRRFDAAATIGITDLLARGFLGASRIARALRGAALTGLDLLPAPRRFFARRMIFGPSALP